MTKSISKRRSRIPIPLQWDTAAFALLSAFCLLLILRNPDIAISNVSSALRLCVTTVIPSLFPFMVISELIVRSDAVSIISPIIARPCKRIFGISAESSAAVVLGLLCGSPIGARCASSLYRQGKIGISEYTHLLTFSNNPSSAFLISAVGTAMFESETFGIVLYCVSLISSVLIGVGGCYINKKKTPRLTGSTDITKQKGIRGGIAAFTGAVTSSALSMLSVCAFIVFFSTLVGTLNVVAEGLPIPQWLNALFFGFFEMTSGVSRASALTHGGAYVAAFCVGWSGLSVHFQVMSVCGGDKVSFLPYILSKLVCGILNCLQIFVLETLFGFTL